MRTFVITVAIVLAGSPAFGLEKESQLLTDTRIQLFQYSVELLALAPSASSCDDAIAIYSLVSEIDTIGAYFWGFTMIYEMRAGVTSSEDRAALDLAMKEQEEFMAEKFRDEIQVLDEHMQMVEMTQVKTVCRKLKNTLRATRDELKLPKWQE